MDRSIHISISLNNEADLSATRGESEYIMKNTTQQYDEVHDFINEYLTENPFTFRNNAIEIGIEYADEKGYDVEYIREQLSNALNNECYFATFKNLDDFCKQFEWCDNPQQTHKRSDKQ